MPNSPSPPGAPPCPRVLLVDDHADSAELLRVLLSRRGFAVTVAGSVGSALAAASEAPFDVLVSDIQLPDGRGHGLLQQLRASPGEAGAPAGRLPAIAVSGLDSEADVQSARDAGFDDYLIKPVSVDQLADALHRVLR